MKVAFEYCIRFGKLDCSDLIPWEMEITEEESVVSSRADLLERAGDEIREELERTSAEVGDEFDDNWIINVYFKD